MHKRRLLACSSLLLVSSMAIGAEVSIAPIVWPTIAFGEPGYTPNGSFTVGVADSPGCTGIYTVNSSPVTTSAPDGSTPPFTAVVTYIGFPQGNFLFANAGWGLYTTTVTNTNAACGESPIVRTIGLVDQTVGVSPTSGPRGTQLTISGSQCVGAGFYGSWAIFAPGVDPSSGSPIAAGDVLVDPAGNWSDTSTVPLGAPLGTYTVFAACVDQLPNGRPAPETIVFEYGSGSFEVTAPIAAAPIPTLSQWAMVFLFGLLAFGAMDSLRRRRG